MELEQRVKLLEQEVKLLKNEVQATLLDIQEQLLSTRHPGLRAEAGRQAEIAQHPSGTPAAASEASGNERQSAKPASPAPVKVVPSVDPASLMPPVEARLPASGNGGQPAKAAPPPAAVHGTPRKGGRLAKMAPVPMPGLAPGANHDPTRLPNLRTGVEAAPDSPMDWETLSRQTNWTIQTIQKLGPERTRQLIEVYTQSGLVSDKVSVILQRVAAAFQPERVLAENEKSPPKKAAERAEENGALDKAQQRNIVLRLINYLQSSGARQEAPHG